MAVNLGTRGTREAMQLLEYTNVPTGTARAEERRSNGRDEPFGIRMWCLGNEMDGNWQIGYKSAEEYGTLAAVTARAMRAIEPDLELVACGSSSRGMPTFGAWERTVLERAFDEIDYISCHAYYHELDGDVASFLASGVDMDDFIEGVVATIDHVRAVKKSQKQINISFDEWNIWYGNEYVHETAIDRWPTGARLLEDQYSVTDAVVLGGLLISLLKHVDRVTAASLAQLVNVIAPIMTEPGGSAWKQTTFFPFAETSRNATGAALRGVLDSPTVQTSRFGEVLAVDAVATTDGTRSSIFVINRSLDDTIQFAVDVEALAATGHARATGIWDDDRHAKNTADTPDRVILRANDTLRREDGRLLIDLPPISWTCITLG
jgi:alpha-N-arabinofuranosidase